MQAYQRSFIEFALERKALRFGSFTLKSGRQSPYFFNTGVFDSGDALGRLGQYYAAALAASALSFDMLFGPAYKGIPLGAAAAISLSRDHQRDVPFCFNRKEAKDHGEGGTTLGAPLTGRVVIVDDVISAGTSVNESVGIIRAAGAEPVGVLISLDRQERGQGALSAAQEVERQHGMPVLSIVTLGDVRQFLADRGDAAQDLAAIAEYCSRYGAGPGAAT
jgi:orotate phosphoribosyltransferase